MEWEEVKVKIDLAAERLIAAQRGEEKIAVEINSWVWTVAWSPDGQTLAERSADQTVKLGNVQILQFIWEVKKVQPFTNFSLLHSTLW